MLNCTLHADWFQPPVQNYPRQASYHGRWREINRPLALTGQTKQRAGRNCPALFGLPGGCSFLEIAAPSDPAQVWAGLVLSCSGFASDASDSHWCALSELVTHPAEGWNFARFVIHDKLRGGFLPVFWDVSRVSMHAVGDIGAVVEWLSKMQTFQADAKSSLAVLHNLNTMVNLFQASNWVTGQCWLQETRVSVCTDFL